MQRQDGQECGNSADFIEWMGQLYYKVYSRRGRLHRVDGPARTKGSISEWWVDDHRLTHEELKTWKYLLTCDPGELLLYVSEPLYAPILEMRLQ